MPKVAEILVEMLALAGVKRIFGVSGDSLNAITEAIRKHKQLEWLHMRHEEAAAFAAGAEAWLLVEGRLESGHGGVLCCGSRTMRHLATRRS